MRVVYGLMVAVLFLGGCQTVRYGLEARTKKYAVLEVQEGENTREILGYLMDAGRLGRGMPVAFFSLTGQQMCSGTYTMLKPLQPGTMSLDCFEGRMKSEGTFHVTAKRGKVSTGIATLNTPNEEIRVVFGLTEQELLQKKMASKAE